MPTLALPYLPSILGPSPLLAPGPSYLSLHMAVAGSGDQPHLPSGSEGSCGSPFVPPLCRCLCTCNGMLSSIDPSFGAAEYLRICTGHDTLPDEPAAIHQWLSINYEADPLGIRRYRDDFYRNVDRFRPGAWDYMFWKMIIEYICIYQSLMDAGLASTERTY